MEKKKESHKINETIDLVSEKIDLVSNKIDDVMSYIRKIGEKKEDDNK